MEFDPVNFHNRGMEKFIGSAIKQLRVNAQLTQEQLAERIGFSFGHVSKIECKERSPSMRVLGDIARVLDMPVSTIIELAEQLSSAQCLAVSERAPSYILTHQRVMAPFMRLSVLDQSLVELLITRLDTPSDEPL